MVIEKFEAGEFDVCTIFYNQFKNVITQIPQAQQIIPLNNDGEENSSEESYEFEPDEDEILSNLLPKNISTQIFKAMLENSAEFSNIALNICVEIFFGNKLLKISSSSGSNS